MPSSTKAASGFSDLNRRNGDGDSIASRLFPRKVDANHENRTIVLAVVFGILGSIAVLFLIYYLGRRYLSRQSNPASADMIIEKPIEISSPIQTKHDYPPTPTTPYKPANSPSKLPEIAETAAFIINHPYGHPYAARDTTSVSMPASTLGTASTVDSSSIGPISIQSMPHPYSSQPQQQHRTMHHYHFKRRGDPDHSQQAYTNNNNNNNTQARTATIPTVDEGRQQYESFMSPDTPRLSIKELGSSSLGFPDSTAEQPDINTTAATGSGSKTSLTTTTATAEKRGRTGTGGGTASKTLKLTYPPSVHTYDTVHSEDTLPSMYSYTSTSGPVPIQELHFPQPHHSIVQSRSQFRQ